MKTQIKSNSLVFIVLLLLSTGINSCSPTIALFDQDAFSKANTLKTDMQTLVMESSTTTFPDAKADIDKVDAELQSASDYAKGKPKNTSSAGQYATLLSDGGFYKSFLSTWQKSGKISATAAMEKSKKIGQLLDKIIELENEKKK